MGNTRARKLSRTPPDNYLAKGAKKVGCLLFQPLPSGMVNVITEDKDGKQTYGVLHFDTFMCVAQHLGMGMPFMITNEIDTYH